MAQIPSREEVRRLVEAALQEFGPTFSAAGPSGAGEASPRPRPPAPGAVPAPSPLLSPQALLQPGAARRVAIGSDHGGFVLKRRLVELLEELGYEAVDVGTHDRASCDYPDFAIEVGRRVQGGACRFGVMIDGAGIGSAMALNKMKGIRAATVHNEATAVNSREHNDANVLVLGSGQIHAGHACRVLRLWLKTEHAGGRHAKRVAKIDALDGLPPRG